jgi:tRNA nucleotidyltransferase (CCA-adding enzyme)
LNDAARLARLPRGLESALRPVRRAAASSNVRVALVGGAVRDRLLGRPHSAREADVAVEGSAPELARAVAREERSAKARIHERFGTATLEMGSGWRVDLAGTRREKYRHPGALPDVEPATLEEDLVRRDFTANAMAFELGRPGRPGVLHDPFGGAEDLRRRRLRALHPASFRDDPTRAFRAVRYANRLGFRIDPRTRGWIAEALRSGALAAVSGDRVRRELEKIFSERGWAALVRALAALGIAAAVHPDLAAGPRNLAALSRSERLERDRAETTSVILPLLVWSDSVSPGARGELATRLGLAGRARDSFVRWPQTRDALARGEIGKAGWDERMAAAALLGSGRSGEKARRRILAADAALSIRGSDLLRAGIPAGPRVGRALARTREALALGKIDAGEELSYALAAARTDP